MGKLKLKIGDRVIVSVDGFCENEKGTIIALDNSIGYYLVKCDNDIDSYSECSCTGYISDKNDLIWSLENKTTLID